MNKGDKVIYKPVNWVTGEPKKIILTMAKKQL